MSTRFYDADLTDAAWAFVEPVLPAARPGGRPRTTNWLGRNRRLSKDYEYRVQTSETMIDLAAIRLTLNRIATV